MLFTRRRSVSKKFYRGVLSISMVFWLTFTTTGLLGVGGVSSVAGLPQGHQCSCDIQKQRSKNCCCYKKESCNVQKKSCCSSGKTLNTQQKESSGGPEFHSYCGTSTPNGAIINREPRLSMVTELLTPLLASGQTIEIVDDALFETTSTIDPRPPKV